MAAQRTESDRIIAIEATYEHLATKADVANLRTDIANLRTELKSDDGMLKSDLQADIASLRKESGSFQSRVDTSFRNLKWFLGILFTLATIAVAVINIVVTIALALILRGA